MKTLTCDICHNVIDAPVPERNYYHMAHRDVCVTCHDKLDYQIKPVVRTRAPFSYDWYTKMVQDNIEKAVQKGKVDVKFAF